MTVIREVEKSETNSAALDKVAELVRREKEELTTQSNTPEEAELTSIAYLLRGDVIFGKIVIPYLYPNMMVPITFLEAKKHGVTSIVYSVEATACLVNTAESREEAAKNKSFSDAVREGKEGFYSCVILTHFAFGNEEYLLRLYPYTLDMLDKEVTWIDDRVANLTVDFDQFRGAIKEHNLPGDKGTNLMQHDPFTTVFTDADMYIMQPKSYVPFNQMDGLEANILDNVVKINDADDLDFFEDLKTAMGVSLQCL